eukprot:g4759.t1
MLNICGVAGNEQKKTKAKSMFSSTSEEEEELTEEQKREEEEKKKKEEGPVQLYDYRFARNYAHNVGLFKSHVWRDSLKTEKQYNYITYKCFHENIMPHDFGRKTWEEFVDSLDDKECQYTVFDIEYCLDPRARLGSKKRRLKHSNVLITWVPKQAKPIDRRLYTMQRKDFRRQFGPAGSWINVDLLCVTKEPNCWKVNECENLKPGKTCPHSACEAAVLSAVRKCAPAPDKQYNSEKEESGK